MLTTVYSDTIDGLVKEQSLLFNLGYLPNSKIIRVDNIFYRDFKLQERNNDIICCLFISLKKYMEINLIKKFKIYDHFFKYPYRIYFKVNRNVKDLDIVDFVLGELLYMETEYNFKINNDFLKNELLNLIKDIRNKNQGYFNIEIENNFLNITSKEVLQIHYHKYKI